MSSMSSPSEVRGDYTQPLPNINWHAVLELCEWILPVQIMLAPHTSVWMLVEVTLTVTLTCSTLRCCKTSSPISPLQHLPAPIWWLCCLIKQWPWLCLGWSTVLGALSTWGKSKLQFRPSVNVRRGAEIWGFHESLILSWGIHITSLITLLFNLGCTTVRKI